MKSKHPSLPIARIAIGVTLAAMASLSLVRHETRRSNAGTAEASETPVAITLSAPQIPDRGADGERDVNGDAITLTSALDPGAFRRLDDSARKDHLDQIRIELGHASTEEEARTLAECLAALDHADAIETLVAAYGEADSSDRKALIATALRTAPGIDQEAREIITSIVASPHDTILRTEAAEAVARFANHDAVAHLLELFAEPDVTEGSQLEIERTIRGIRNPIAAGALGTLVDGADENLAEAAITALSAMPTRESFVALVEAARRTEGNLRLNLRILEIVSAMRVTSSEGLEGLIGKDYTQGPLQAAIDLAIRTSRISLPPHRM